MFSGIPEFAGAISEFSLVQRDDLVARHFFLQGLEPLGEDLCAGLRSQGQCGFMPTIRGQGQQKSTSV